MMLVARPLSEWTEEDGDVLWWKFPIEEAPYVGSPRDLGQDCGNLGENILYRDEAGSILGRWLARLSHALDTATEPANRTYIRTTRNG